MYDKVMWRVNEFLVMNELDSIEHFALFWTTVILQKSILNLCSTVIISSHTHTETFEKIIKHFDIWKELKTCKIWAYTCPFPNVWQRQRQTLHKNIFQLQIHNVKYVYEYTANK